METLPSKNHGTVIVDYAHNKGLNDSLIMSFMQREFNNQRSCCSCWAPGDKGSITSPWI